MLVKTDDNLYRVDRTYLGPKVFRFPWRATYRDYGVWLGLMLLTGLVAWKVGIPANFLTVCLWPLLAARLTQSVSKALDHDRPLREEMVRLGQELTAKRPNLGQTEVVDNLHLSARRWRYGAAPDRRRLVRWWFAAVAAVVGVAEAVHQVPKRIRRSEREDLAAADPELAAELAEVETFTDPEGPSPELAAELAETTAAAAGEGGPDGVTNPWIAAAAHLRAEPTQRENS